MPARDPLPEGPDGVQEVAGRILVGWAVPGDAGPVLGEVDARRLAGFRSERRAAFLTGRALLVRLLDDLLGERFGALSVDTGRCPHCGGEHGPVAVWEDRVSVSHAPGPAMVEGEGAPAGHPAELEVAGGVRASVGYAPGLVVAAVGEVERLGVDVVDDLPSPRWEDLGRLLRVAPDLAARRWTQVEAVLKADGRGLRVDPEQVLISGSVARVDGPVRYQLEDVEALAPYVISVAWASS